MITDEDSLRRAEKRGDEVRLLNDNELVNRAGLEQHPFEGTPRLPSFNVAAPT